MTGESGAVRGTSLSTDGGRTWEPVGDTGCHTLDCTRDGSCWAAGGGGRIARRSTVRRTGPGPDIWKCRQLAVS